MSEHEVPPTMADICLVGAGAAGLTLATTLADGGMRVVLVEAGGDVAGALGGRADPALEGETEGFPFGGLTEGRARVFGGATTLWFGQCIRLDAIDFARRPWVPDSGWPFGPEALEDDYAAAEAMVGIDEPIYDARRWAGFGVAAPGFDTGALRPKFTIYFARPDLGRRFGPKLRGSPDVEIVTNATVTALHATPDADAVTAATLRADDGTTRRVRARAFVLCGGGIENARLLLASRDIVEAGLGNRHDQVGRYLQDHPSGRTAEVVEGDTARLQEIFAHRRRGALRFWPKLALDAEVQRHREVLNANGYLVYDYGAGSSAHALKTLLGRATRDDVGRIEAQGRGAMVRAILHDAPRLARDAVRAVRGGRMPAFPPTRVWLQAFSEQRPDPANRVTLGKRRDPHGVPVARVTWRLGEAERATLATFTDAVADDFARHGLGRVIRADWLDGTADDLAGRVNDAYHHAGTTRISEDPRRGVVDADCRVHGIRNLFVAGSSVFPTSGYANPTLTIMALALRLGRHLRTVVPALPEPDEPGAGPVP